jgi:exopolyphosphatase/guanosine-5'-triphosphate,3'-diphosphate pyrophosphatase
MIACDLGSNTLRIVEIECETFRRVKEFERMVKTADGLHESGRINDEAITRIIRAIEEAKEIFDLSRAYAVTTAAVRMATNGAEVLDEIASKTGVRFIMIDAKEEARLTTLAVTWRLDSLGYHDNFMLVDLGGGSTEISIKSESKSFDIGIVTMAQKYASAQGVRAHLEEELSPLVKFIQRLEKPKLFVATAGTPTTIAAFKQGLDYAHYDVEKVNGTYLSLEDLDFALDRLISMDVVERERWVGVGRDNLIVAGVLIIKHIMIAAGFSEMLVIDDGLREGLAFEKCRDKTKFSA